MVERNVTEYVPGHGDHRYAVRHYDLDLVYKVATNHLSGTANLVVVPLTELRELSLDLVGLHVSRVRVDGRPPARYAHRGHRVDVRLTGAVPVGTELTVQVAYAGKPRPVRGVGRRRLGGALGRRAGRPASRTAPRRGSPATTGRPTRRPTGEPDGAESATTSPATAR